MTDPARTDGPAQHLRDLLNEIRARTSVNGRSMPFDKIAERAGTGSGGYVSDVLKGRRGVPSPDTAVAFARAMNATRAEADRVFQLAEQARTIRDAKPDRVRIPRLLEPARAGFVGRSDDFNELSSLAGLVRKGTAQRTITRVSGLGGVGKTWFVLQWAHRNIARFPDGQLYADLRGLSERQPAPAPAVLPRFLRAFGVASASVPEDIDDQIALYRELTRGRRLLVVLDNVDETRQIKALLPDGPSVVVVTSRNHLRDLLVGYGAGAIQLAGLADTEARSLLAAGPVAARAKAEPVALAELVEMCGGLPMALSIVRSQAVIQSRWPLREVVAYYRDAPSPVDVMTSSDESADLRRIFWSEYGRFSPDLRAAFLALGLCPGVEMELAGVASMLRRAPAETAGLLEALASKSLLEQPARDRFRMHDLLWSFAAGRAAAELSAQDQAAARRRLAASLLAGAYAGQRELSPNRPAITLDEPDSGVVPQLPAGDAMDWFDAHYATLTALQRYADEQRWDAMVWQLAWSLDDYHYRRGLIAAHQQAWRRGLAAAERSGEPGAVALGRLCLGNILARAGRHDEAVRLLEPALAYFEEAGDMANLAQVHRALQFGLPGQDEHGKLYHAKRALELFRELGNPVWIAIALNALGESYAMVGEPGQARVYCQEALDLHRERKNKPGEAAALDSLGIAAAAAGDPAGAVNHYRAAVELYTGLKNLSSAANTLTRLGEALAALPGRAAEARAAWIQACELLEDQGRDDEADRVRRRIAEF